MDKTIIAIGKAVRPRQWLKNLTIFAGIFFTGRLFNPEDFFMVLRAFLVFCATASAIYIFNDLIDAPKDKLHPFKRKRPIAAGDLSKGAAFTLATSLIIFAILFSLAMSAERLVLAVVAYIALQLLYMNVLKNIIILDVLAIASGFLLRIYAGIWVINTHLNIWFLLCVISFALFIAVGKRRAEATLLQGFHLSEGISMVRATLGHYPESLLHAYTTMFATATWVTYAIFAFYQPTITPTELYATFLRAFIPRVINTKWLMITVPIVIYGVMRYLYLIYEKKEGESPERMLLSDKPLLTAVLIWGVMTFAVLYILVA